MKKTDQAVLLTRLLISIQNSMIRLSEEIVDQVYSEDYSAADLEELIIQHLETVRTMGGSAVELLDQLENPLEPVPSNK